MEIAESPAITAEVLGARIRNARFDSGLTQAEAADASGMTRQNWAKYERGEKLASVPILVRIGKALGASAKELLPELLPPPE